MERPHTTPFTFVHKFVFVFEHQQIVHAKNKNMPGITNALLIELQGLEFHLKRSALLRGVTQALINTMSHHD